MTETPTITVHTALDRAHVADVLRELRESLGHRPERIVLDLGQVDWFDSAGMGGIVVGLRACQAAGVELKLRGLSQPMLDFFSLISVDRLIQPTVDDREAAPVVARLGAWMMPAVDSMAAIGHTAVGVAKSIFVDSWRGRRLRFDRIVLELDQTAIGALPIIALIAFLIGLVMAMQAYVQLQVWGAEIYMADMVGVSIVTEIGPLMTGIVLAARSGSANAAQLGSMVVGEEIDALRQMGIHPTPFLVVPKVLALAASAVALGIVFDVVGICGGAVFAHLVADIDPSAYRAQTQAALRAPELLVAFVKSLGFGACVGVVGCALGLRVKGGSHGVGAATTHAVVLSVFLIIVFDAIFVAAQRLVL